VSSFSRKYEEEEVAVFNTNSVIAEREEEVNTVATCETQSSAAVKI
jgi:hypothetical protein